MIGQKIAHYTITDKLGEGAMGEVYRATDTRLNRTVAIKMLSGRFAGDPALLERLRQEAEVLASLSHAHIGQIYGIEEAGGSSLALVLEYVDGPTLAERLERAALPQKVALRVACQIAGALESAHERGVIHRDLKPGNIKLTGDGDVKVLDFGLAKGIDADAAKTGMTADGVVLGTPRYMSPEQVEGRKLDRRTDIWSFGCVLYEMLTGRRAFDAESVGSLFTAIALKEVDLGLLAGAPPALRRLVERCLRKDPRTRLRDIGDARIELEEILSGRTEFARAQPDASRRRPVLTPVVAALVVGALVGVFLVRTLWPETRQAPEPVERYAIALPPRLHLDSPTGLAPPLAISPDGQAVVFAAADDQGQRSLWLRRADSGEVRKLEGTTDAEVPFFSPDGAEVGFLLHGAALLHAVSLADSRVRKICDTSAVRGATWGSDGTIVFAQFDKGLMRVAASGEEAAETLTTPSEGELDHRWPQFLPDAKSLLFTASLRDHFEPRVLLLETGEVTAIPVRGAVARYVEGHLVLCQSNDLMAAPFDLATRATTGAPKRILSGIHSPAGLSPYFAVSPNGVLVFEPVRPPSPGRGLVWVEREGKVVRIASGMLYEFPRLTPSGDTILAAIHTATGNHELWTFDAEHGLGTRIAYEGNSIQPVWSPGTDAVAFTSVADGNLYTQAVGGSEQRRLLDRDGFQYALCWRGDGRLLFTEQAEGRGFNLLDLDVKDGSVRTLVDSFDNEQAGAISPDGRWLAYVSDETGRNEIHLRSYSDVGTKRRVSSDGGTEPVWSRDGRELYFRKDRDLWVVEIGTGPGLVGTPRKLFDGPFVDGFFSRPNYDVAPDGRFVMVEGGVELTKGHLDVHLNLGREIEVALAREK